MYNVSMRKIPREVYRCESRNDPVETTRQLLSNSMESELRMYILGALHDATYSKKHKTFRFSQSSEGWLKIVQVIFSNLGQKSWIYREGKDRFVWVLETSMKIDQDQKPANNRDKIAYIRGYFDAEGGMPKNNNDFLYFQFSQKDYADLNQLKSWLEDIGIKCGKIHNPSKKVDDNYWRFFVSRQSHRDFMERIGSWHPRKMNQIEFRMKI